MFLPRGHRRARVRTWVTLTTTPLSSQPCWRERMLPAAPTRPSRWRERVLAAAPPRPSRWRERVIHAAPPRQSPRPWGKWTTTFPIVRCLRIHTNRRFGCRPPRKGFKRAGRVLLNHLARTLANAQKRLPAHLHRGLKCAHPHQRPRHCVNTRNSGSRTSEGPFLLRIRFVRPLPGTLVTCSR